MNRLLSSGLLLLLVLPIFAFIVRANPDPLMYVSPASQTENVGDTFSVAVAVANVVNTTCWQFTLDFDNTVLSCTGAAEGSFLKSGGGTYFYKSINNANGYVSLSSTLMGLNVSVSGSGTLATVTFKAIASGQSTLHLADTLLGDTNIPPIDIPHTTSDGTVYVQAVQRKLTVSSAHDTPNPANGDTYYNDGQSVTCSVSSPVTESSTVWTCTGWSGTGSVPSSGSSTSVTFTISQDSTITWNWQGTPVQRKLTVSSAHDSPSPSNGDHFYNDGTSVTCTVTSPVTEAGITYVCNGWSGTGSVPSSGTGTSTGSFTISQDSSITWNWAIVQRKLTVSSAHDSPNPSVGDHLYNDGSSVTCSVTSPVTEGSTVWTCSGWSGTGSVPSTGSGTSVTFTISQNSTITWNWQGTPVQRKLTVSSGHDTPVPSVGDHYYNDGQSVTCSVTSPVTEGSTVWTCTGWSGTGSVPASGSDSSVTFTISQDSTITWNWQSAPVQRRLTVSSARDSPSPPNGNSFYNDGTSVTCSINSPVTEGGITYVCTGWSGTGSVPASGTGYSTTFTISQDSSITWNWAIVQRKLTVSSAHDSPNPSVGDHLYNDGSSVTCSVTSPVTEGSTVWTCTGWSGTGSVPTSGTGSSVTFTISQNSTITWNWQGTPVQRKLTVSSAHDSPSPSNGGHYYNDGTSVTCSVTSPVTESGITYVCNGWSGSGSVPASGSGTSVTFTITQDSSITWAWSTVYYTLTVSSAHDNPNPSSGPHQYQSGSSVTCSVTSPITEGSTVWTCTGWSGTGAVPASGSGGSVTFTLSQDSTITWDWQGVPVQRKLTVTSAHDNPSPPNGDSLYSDGTSVTCSVTSPVTEGGVTHVCTGWSGTGSVPASGSGSSTSFTITQNSSITWSWALIQRKLTVNSAHDTPTPSSGDHYYSDGQSVTCSVTSPVTEGSTVWTCTGWSGTGSVPSGGSGKTVTFTISQDSTITWNWQGQVNQPPVASNLQLSPSSPRKGDSLTASYTYYDADGDPEGASEIRWYMNSILQSAYNNMKTVPGSATAKSQTWYFTVRPYDGKDFGNLQTSPSVTVQNTPPAASNLSLNPPSPKMTDSLVGSYTYTDIDGDVETGSEIRWYKDGGLQSAYNDVKTIPAGATLKGQVWYFTVRPKDGVDFGTLQTSPSVTIQNSPPVASSLSVSPASPKKTDTLVGSYVFSDADGDPESGSEIRWYMNGALQSGYNDQLTVPSSAIARSQTWYFTVKPKDGRDFGTLQTSPSVTIQNTPPEASNLSLTPSSPTKTDTLVESYTYVDIDGDVESGSEIRWYMNGALQSAYNNLKTVPATALARGQTWYFTVKPKDGTDFGQLKTSPSVTVGNSPPVASNLIITPSSPRTIDNLVASYTYFDADGDVESGSEIRWYLDGALQAAYNDLRTVPSSAMNAGDTWYFTVRPKDGTDFGDMKTSSSVIVTRNTPPEASNLVITPPSPYTTDSLVASYSYHDVDGDIESGSEIRWYRNGVLQSAYNDLKTIPQSATTKGEAWYFTVRPKDGFDFGILQTSSSVTIQNSAPVASGLSISPSSPKSTDNLVGSYGYSDVDGDSESGSEIRWYKAGSLQPAYNDLKTVPSSALSDGQVWYFTVRPRDGQSFGVLQQSPSVTVGRVNIAPVASNVAINPSSPHTTDDLAGSYSYYDVDGDPESGTEVRWYKNGVVQSVYNNGLIVPSNAISAGEAWYFTVRPKDGKDFGALQISPSVTILAIERDVAVTKVFPFKTIAGRGHPMFVNVTVENQGNSAETFNVTAYANTTVIRVTTITLNGHSSTTLVVEWNTTGLAIGNYTVTANATVLPGETDVADNAYTFGIVFVGIPGDLNRDGKVNIVDVTIAAVTYSCKPGDKKWNANADINCDGVVNITDIAKVAKEYGRSQ